MAVEMTSCKVTNRQSIAVKVTIEAGAKRETITVGPMKAGSFLLVDFNDIQSARLVADFGDPNHPGGEQAITLTGTPAPVYLQTLSADASIGAVKITSLAATQVPPPAIAASSKKKSRLSARA